MYQATEPRDKICLSLIECEWLTSLSRATLNRAINSGDLDSIKVGRRRVVPREALLDYIKRKQVEANSPEAA